MRSPRTRWWWRSRGCRSRGNGGRCRSAPRCTAPCCRPSRRRAPPISLPWACRSWGLSKQLVELSLVLVVAEHLVELSARLHRRHDALLRALATDRREYRDLGLGRSAEGRQRVEHEAHAGVAELGEGEERRLPELGDVGEHRDADPCDELPVLIESLHGLGEDHVCAGG